MIDDEILHEAKLSEQILRERSNLANIREVIYGMTDSLVEILALMIGLASIINNTLMIGLAGLLAAIGGTFSITTGSYLGAKSQNNLAEGEMKGILSKAEFAPE